MELQRRPCVERMSCGCPQCHVLNEKGNPMRIIAIFAAALVSFRIISNLIHNRRFMAQPVAVRRLNRRYL
jgi:hypothetical protein